VKKCASCTKDLPDAALHCVFCGAKQAPSPASPPAAAKTVMGYGGPELDALRAQAAAQNAGRSGAPSAPPPNIPAAAPYGAPRANPSNPPPMGGPQLPPTQAQAPYVPHAPNTPPAPSYQAPGALAPATSASARTMFQDAPASGGPGAGPSMGGPMSSPSGPSPAGSFNVPPPSAATLATHEANRLPMPSAQPAPMTPTPQAPAVSPPYLASQTAGRAARPIEPFKDSLRTMLFIWGGLLLAAFATPLSTEPLVFNWDIIINGEGAQKLPPLIMAAVGLLSVVMATIPLAAGARGAISLVLGLTGIFVPMFLGAIPPWQMLVAAVGLVMLPMGLLARSEYRDAKLPRIVVTIGALCYLALWLVPAGDTVPLVALFSGVVNAPGAFKIILILFSLQVILVVLSLLCWLPSPATGGAKVIAWMLILYPLIMFAAALFLLGDPGKIADAPGSALAWLWGGGGEGGGGMGGGLFAGVSLGVAYLAITGYGGATVLGKSLE
jgi:hypothetical protein